jgi:hypothetical protein
MKTHAVNEADLRANPESAPAGFQADDRLAKTLLLSAVAPDVPALKQLTAGRLASLNHGSIVSPLQGHEAAIVLGKVREWAGTIPEIHIGDDPRNPVIGVRLADVNYESVVERVRGEDNEGRRRELVKQLVREAVGVAATEADMFGAIAHPIVWRGSRREVDLVFGNVRDAGWLTEEHFRAHPGTWRFVVDHPFDDPGHSAGDDLARLDRLRDAGLRSSTVVWLPRFLTQERMTEVSRLVLLEWLLGGTGERWTTNSDHLSEGDRSAARAILESQRANLRERVRRALQEAYGATAPTGGTVVDDPGHDRVLISLDPGFDAALPVGVDLAAAFADLVDRAFSSSSPGHPRFEPTRQEVTTRELVTTYALVERAVADPDGRVFMEPSDRPAVRRVASPLGVGTATETHYLFGDDRFSPWGAEFERALTRDGLGPHDPVRVERVRAWMEAIRPAMGLRLEVQDLVILAWGALRQRAWYLHGSSIPTPRPGQLRGEMELRPEALPAPADWDRAVTRAAQLFGVTANRYLTAAGVATLIDELRGVVGRWSSPAVALVLQLESAYRRLNVDATVGRLASARAAAALIETLAQTSDRVQFIGALASAVLPATEEAVAASASSADDVGRALRAFHWERMAPLQAAEGGDEQRSRQARAILDSVRDEIAVRLGDALTRCEAAAFEWVADGIAAVPHSPVPPSPPAGAHGARRRRAGEDATDTLMALGAFLDEHPDADVVVDWRVDDTSR